jgi:hypothetical protein
MANKNRRFGVNETNKNIMIIGINMEVNEK